MFEDKTYKRCACKGTLTDSRGRPQLDQDGNPKIGYLERKCPQLKKSTHGSWYYSLEGPPGPGRRQRLRQGGFRTQKQAAKAAKAAYEAAESGIELTSTETVAEYLERWVESVDVKFTTRCGYKDYIRLYWNPHLGHLKLSQLRPHHIQEMFTQIALSNDEKELNQDLVERAREAERAAHRAWREAPKPRDPRLRADWQAAREELKEALARPRRLTGPATQKRIKIALSSALNTAHRQRLIPENWASYVLTPKVTKPKPIVWTKPRVETWRQTGKKPGPVMVWTPTQVGRFLDSVVDDRLYALWHLLLIHGVRRGEACALSWSEIDFDEGVVHITEEIVTFAYEPHEDTPKSDRVRVITLDAVTLELLRLRKLEQEAELRIWAESTGEVIQTTRVFTTEDGATYNPNYFSDRFKTLYRRADLPPIRLHDTRHTSATLSLRAGVAPVVIQRRLGHSTLSITSDIYTGVLPSVFRKAAADTLDAVPRHHPHAEPAGKGKKNNKKKNKKKNKPDTGAKAAHDSYAFNRALNHEAALVLVADGHPPAQYDKQRRLENTGFDMGLLPEITEWNPDPRIIITFPVPEPDPTQTDPDTRKQAWEHLRQEARQLRDGCVRSLAAAGWAIEPGEGPFLRAAPPATVRLDALDTLND